MEVAVGLLVLCTTQLTVPGRIVDLDQCDTVHRAILEMDDENSCTRHAVRSEEVRSEEDPAEGIADAASGTPRRGVVCHYIFRYVSRPVLKLGAPIAIASDKHKQRE